MLYKTHNRGQSSCILLPTISNKIDSFRRGLKKIAFPLPFLKVLDESGPPHQKEYKIQCTVGNITVVETGTSKKESKRKAAAAVLPKLKSLPPPVKTVRQGPRMGWKPAYKRSTIQKKVGLPLYVLFHYRKKYARK